MVSFLLILSAPLAMQPSLAMQTVPMRPMPRAVSPSMRATSQDQAIQANLKPDLVVREMRKEGNVLHVLIANQGTADTVDTVRITANARYRSRRGQSPDAFANLLKSGATEWVEFPGFTDDDRSTPMPPRLLSDWDQVTVVVDPPAYEGTALGVMTPSDMMAKRVCTTAHGCIIELDETNNELVTATAAMEAWNGE